MTILRIVCAAIGAFLLAPTAQAADAPYQGGWSEAPAAYYNWTGPYVGAHLGGAWGELQDYVEPGLSAGDVDGVAGGVLGGYNWQHGAWVFGIELDISLAGIDGNDDDFLQEIDVDTFGSVRGRVGYAMDRTLLFVTAGLAIADVELLHEPGDDRASETAMGYVLGAGVEHALTDSLRLRGEYLFHDFGEETYSFYGGTDEHDVDFDEMHVLRAAVVWNFSTGY